MAVGSFGVNETAVREWRHHADRLDEEFGGREILHCHLLTILTPAVTPGKLKACCSATHSKGTPMICRYEQPCVSPEEFLTGLADIMRGNQTDDGPCTACRYLVPTQMPEKFVPDSFSSVSLHDFCGCNSKCVYCHGSEYRLPVEYVASQDHEILFRSLLASGLLKPGATTVAWGGGEPSLVTTFDNTVDFLSSSGVSETINTSGIRFSPAIERALEARMATVRVSVDSGTNEIYEKVKRNPNCDAVWSAIERYAATGGDLVVKYIILSLNSDTAEVEAFVDRCVMAGVTRICISVDVRSVWEHHSNAPKLTDKELAAAAAIYNRAKANGIEPYFEEIWSPEHIESIGRLGGFGVGMVPESTVGPTAESRSGLLVRVLRRIKRAVSN